MSGLEITGLILGIIPLLTEAVQIARSLKDCYKRFRLTKKEASHIENSLEKLRNGLLRLQRQYGNAQIDIPDENASIIKNDFKDLENALKDILERFKPISKPDRSNLLTNLKAVVSGNKPSSYDDIIARLDRASERLRHMNQLLVNMTLNMRMSIKQDEIFDQLESLKDASSNSSVLEDAYTPSFYVPANPPIAKECLDYDTVDEHGDPVTFEGMLKADLLRRVRKRHENHTELPILGAVGMRGVGKTCALRGLGIQKDIRDLFYDGILFLSFSQSSSEQDIKEVLCSIVFLTGGRNLSQVMKQVMGENAIEDIIGKVSGWFENRKCLFLVDNIWNTPCTGSALLTKLSTVIEKCNVTSGLVYTTTSEIDLFDATVRFMWHPPYSDASCNILMKAAGFSQEQIVEADQEYALRAILDHCKGLKIALVVAGRTIRLHAKRYGDNKTKAWEKYACALMEAPQMLLMENYGDYGCLYSQFSLTLQALSSLNRKFMTGKMSYRIEEAFQALCVANKGEAIRDSMLRRLLNLNSIQEAREISKLFADVSLVEVTNECVDGMSCEEIRVHDIVLDYASYLADQKYVDRIWINGSEVWSLRLLESYFGVDENLVSSPAAFTEWWNGSLGRRRCFHDERIVLSTIWRIIASSRIETGQSLSQNSSRADRMYVFGQWYRPIELVPFFTVQKSALVQMKSIVSILAQEREVHLSGLTRRLLIMACLFISKFDDLKQSSFNATAAIVALFTSINSTCNSNNVSEGSSEINFFAESVLPLDHWEYIKHIVEASWTLYDTCIEAEDLAEKERYHTLGPLLEETSLMKAGIRCQLGMELYHVLPNEEIIDVGDRGGLVFEWADSSRHFLIPVSFLTQETVGGESEKRILIIYLHDVGNNDGTSLNDKPDLRKKLLENIEELVKKDWAPGMVQKMNADFRDPSCSMMREQRKMLRQLVGAGLQAYGCLRRDV